MKSAIECLQARSGEAWLIGTATSAFNELAWQRYHALIAASPPPTILLAERDPLRFLAGFVAAVGANCPVFLANPAGVAADWGQVLAVAQPDVIWSDPEMPSLDEYIPARASSPVFVPPAAIMIATGGSSGQMRFAVHSWQTLMAAVAGFRDYFAVDRVHSICVLPLYHVSGLMQFLRSFTSGGQLVLLPFRDLAAGNLPAIALPDFFLSLVPTQLHRLIAAPSASPHPLTACKAIFLGGAPAWPDLLKQARTLRLPIAPTYGMTETAGQIATLKPADFLAGKTGCGLVLPHAQVQIVGPSGDPLAAGQIGQITSQTPALMLGYISLTISLPDFSPGSFATDDLGYLDPTGHLHIIGRNSQKIITGGENVFPAEVEAALRATNLVADVCVVGWPDRQWGQVVAAVYVPLHKATEAALSKTLEPNLSKFKQPKRWLAVTTLPRNAQGKINFVQLKQIMRRNWG